MGNYKCHNCGSTQFTKEGNTYKCKYCGGIEEIEKTQEKQIDISFKPDKVKHKNNNKFEEETFFKKELKDSFITLLLCFFGGYLGLHKFWKGKIFMGIVYIFTAGLFGIGYIIDVIKSAIRFIKILKISIRLDGESNG